MIMDRFGVLELDAKLSEQKQKARLLRTRLQAREAFILPEVWDVVSARVMADAGFGVIGISADAIAWARGLRQGDRIPLEALTTTAEAIARNFALPINADLEGIAGYTIEAIIGAVSAAVQAGCAGFVIGDGGRGGAQGMASLREMTTAIRCAKATALEMRIPAVITARTEAFLLPSTPYSPFETAIERAEAYLAAGADCIAVPGAQHIQLVERLSAQIDGPLCITLAFTPAPDLKTYANAGVSCVALGSALMRYLLGQLRHKAEEILAFGQFNNLDKAISVMALDGLLH